jgi:hypothetical protein
MRLQPHLHVRTALGILMRPVRPGVDRQRFAQLVPW